MNATRYFALGGGLFVDRPFVASGLSELTACSATVALIVSCNFPLPPLAYAGTVTIEPGRSLLVIAGDQTHVAAVVLASYCLAAAVFFHTTLADHNQTLQFISNVTLTSGLLQIVALGAGAISVDNRRSQDRGLSVRRRGAHRPVAKRSLLRGDKASFDFWWDAFLCVTFHGKKRRGPVFDRALGWET
jgi:putative oxidoreductase